MNTVFLDYDQAALDAAYDQINWAPNRDQLLARYATMSDAARGVLGQPSRLSYGEGKAESCDLYRASVTPAPVRIFIHGGAWRAGSARDAAYPAEMFVAAGAHFIAVEFDHIQDVAGDLRVLAGQVRRAVAWICRNAASFGGDPEGVYLAGHSSGAHLAAVALTTDWSVFGLPRDCIKGGLLISGMYDLHPVRLSARARYVAFDDEVERDFSPIRHLAHLSAPLVVAYGSLESPEFQRQAQAFAAAVAQTAKPCRLVEAPGYNHFELVETVANPFGVLGREALAQMGLSLR